ncbi:dephospho-CoA kinase [Clostridium felsineum]|uniref:Dephospho-CoA kinase n=1 Tax=Clostridium felsineum TaxID=36839 RepID=A0A1S8L112_9CLOT|nr:dephospho-CoA kinase [Clostridium felsineum]MCR3758256.1 dephospho-CoA kinase [Clostridium felsineum]URZ01210.1 Dephospho-CoA kinase [Clostridium felsineum]URZ06034.1 Dephospho-CoA kinase [Clostridium felsineum]URZ11071.1 Dephospho-CoA kinase [Clostridium felsineum]URZ15700.1 Dephospho-CoA kinase [Clostridium felsineum DSM 794]
MLKIGLTGGIGSGKSTISRIFKERQILVVDADNVARGELKEHPEILTDVKNKFGDSFFDERGEFKRKDFGNFIFSSDIHKKEYEDIIMPYIKKDIKRTMDLYESLNENVCVLDAPTLIESGIYKDMDINILVWVDQATQIERVKKRDGLSEKEVIMRINSQMSLEEKKTYVDFIIDNRKDFESTIKQIDRIMESISIMKGK